LLFLGSEKITNINIELSDPYLIIFLLIKIALKQCNKEKDHHKDVRYECIIFIASKSFSFKERKVDWL
jgi:hypothetical protein